MLARRLSFAVYRFPVINQCLASVQMTLPGFGTANTLTHSGVFVSGIQQALCQGSKHEVCVQETSITVRKACCPNIDERYGVTRESKFDQCSRSSFFWDVTQCSKY